MTAESTKRVLPEAHKNEQDEWTCPNGHLIQESAYWEDIGARRSVANQKDGAIQIYGEIDDYDRENSVNEYFMCGICNAEYALPAAAEIEWI